MYNVHSARQPKGWLINLCEQTYMALFQNPFKFKKFFICPAHHLQESSINQGLVLILKNILEWLFRKTIESFRAETQQTQMKFEFQTFPLCLLATQSLTVQQQFGFCCFRNCNWWYSDLVTPPKVHSERYPGQRVGRFLFMTYYILIYFSSNLN